jgi:Zn-finger nucleic acid-binding protein
MSEQARVSVVCPDCGAPLPLEAVEHAVTCRQCGRTSAPAPREIKTVIVERVVVSPDARSASVLAEPECPRCRAKLRATEAHGVPLFGCGVCGGFFLDNDASTRITRAADREIAAISERAATQAVTAVNTAPAGLACPSCSRPMQRVRARGAIDLDICNEHGTWFDAGEVRRVMDAYERSSNSASEVQMAAFRQAQSAQIASMESTSMSVGAIAGISVGVLGFLGALAAGRS